MVHPMTFENDTDFSFQTNDHTSGAVDLPLAKRMGVALVMNDDHKVWIVHDKPLGDPMMWAEYDVDTASLVLVSQSGRLHDLGMPVHKPFRKYMTRAREIYTVYMNGTSVRDAGILPLMVRETGLYHA